MGVNRGSRAMWLACAILVAILAWALLTFLAVPLLVERAYQGGGVPILSELISGRDVHPVEHYQRLARQAVLQFSSIFAVLAAAGLAAIRFRHALRTRIHAWLRTAPVVRTAELLLMGVWFSFVSGVIESVPIGLRAMLTRDPRDAPPPEVIWMGPLAAIGAGTLIAFALAVMLRSRHGLSLRVPVTVFAWGAAYALIRNARLGIQPWAVALLALGLSVQLAVWVSRHGEGWRRFVRATAPAMVVLLLLAVVGTFGLERIRERVRLARLGDAAAGSPNVLFLILDTVRASEMSVYGYTRKTTPALERLAASSVTFDAAIATAPWTLPSHGSLFTGRFAHELSTDFDRGLDDAFPTLAERLAARGYATGGFVGNLVYATTASGLDRGFSAYRDHPLTLTSVLNSSRWTKSVTEWTRSRLGRHSGLQRKTAAQVNREFLGWLSAVGDRPFFAFLNYFDAHHPYETQPEFERRFSETPPRFWLMQGWRRDFSETERQELVDAYDSSIAYIDAEIGRLLEALKARGQLDNTLIVVVGDHGEHFGEHGIYIHGNSLYLPLLHVPLMISLPSRLPHGVRVAEPVSIRDIPATVMDIVQPGEASPLPGESLAWLWTPGSIGASRAPVRSQLTRNQFAHPRDPTQRGLMNSVIDGDHHYIVNGDGLEELYDWRRDLAELHNLADSPAAGPRLVQMRRLLAGAAGPAARTASDCALLGARDLCGDAGQRRAQSSQAPAVRASQDIARFRRVAGGIK